MVGESVRVVTPIQEVHLPVVPPGLILDVGGGGEGIVSRLAEKNACIVDVNLDKIREAQIYGADVEWFACDGQSLCFRSSTFDSATLWFSLAYFSSRMDKELALLEVSRVLRKRGILSILGMLIEDTCETMTFNGHFIYPDGYVSRMSYRVKGNQQQNLGIIKKLVEESGFNAVTSTDHGYWFEMMALKP